MSADTPSSAPSEAIKDRKVVAWIESNLGGRVERYERQPRWRGGWWVDLRRDGELTKLYVREERKEDYPPWPLEHEAGVLQVLEKHGVPVPHVYGICDDPHAVVMQALPGQTNFSNVKDEAERLSVLNHFAESLARMHAIDPQELVKLGVKMPETAEQRSLACFDLCESMYLKGKRKPEPRIEFLRRWVRRNIPKHRTKVSIVAVDSGQFLFENGRVTGLFDFEYGCLGDPMIDMAFIPLRLSLEKGGDLRPLFKRYAELTGETYEIDVLGFHAAWWGLCTPFILTADLHAPPAQAKYFEYVGWYIGAIMSICEVLADMKGITLDRSSTPQPETPSRWASLFDVMGARVPPAAPGEPYEILEQRRVWEFAKRMDAHRDAEAEYLRDVRTLIGRPVRDWAEADAALEGFVSTAGPEHDAVLISLFYRWSLAQASTFLHGMVHLPMLDKSWPRLSQIIAP